MSPRYLCLRVTPQALAHVRILVSGSAAFRSCPTLLRPVLSRIGESELGLTLGQLSGLIITPQHPRDSELEASGHTGPALGADYYSTSLRSVMHRDETSSHFGSAGCWPWCCCWSAPDRRGLTRPLRGRGPAGCGGRYVISLVNLNRARNTYIKKIV